MKATSEAKTAFLFAGLPKNYEGLCRRFLPRPIRDQHDYASTLEMARSLAGYEDEMTADQEDYFDILCTLLEAWDREHVTWPKVSGLELLKHLLDNNGLTGADLSRLLGATSPRLGPMILRGERRITAAHARRLGEHFCLEPGAFLK